MTIDSICLLTLGIMLKSSGLNPSTKGSALKKLVHHSLGLNPFVAAACALAALGSPAPSLASDSNSPTEAVETQDSFQEKTNVQNASPYKTRDSERSDSTQVSSFQRVETEPDFLPLQMSFQSTLIGQSFQGTLTERIGSGTFADVYRITLLHPDPTQTKKPVQPGSTRAIKIFKYKKPDALNSFIRDRETRMAEQIRKLQRSSSPPYAAISILDLVTITAGQHEGMDDSIAILMQDASASLSQILHPQAIRLKEVFTKDELDSIAFLQAYEPSETILDLNQEVNLPENSAFPEALEHLLHFSQLRTSLDDLKRPILQIEAMIALITRLERKIAWLQKQKLGHGDLKPGNLLVTQNLSIVLSDFGSTRELDTKLGRIATTFNTIAPETYLLKIAGRWIDASNYDLLKHSSLWIKPSSKGLEAIQDTLTPLEYKDLLAAEAEASISSQPIPLQIEDFVELPLTARADYYSLGKIVINLLLGYGKRLEDLKIAFRSMQIQFESFATVTKTHASEISPKLPWDARLAQTQFAKAQARLLELLESLLNYNSESYFQDLNALLYQDYVYGTGQPTLGLDPLDILLKCNLSHSSLTQSTP